MEKQKQLYLESEVDDYPLRSRLGASAQVVGTTNLYENGQLNYIPMPTPDPKGKSGSSTAQYTMAGPQITNDVSR